VYRLVYTVVVSHEIYRELLKFCLNNPELLLMVQRPEQSGKTFACTLIAWLSNLCYGQCAYVLLRTGSGASEDYEKDGEKVDELNKMIWEVMVGHTFEGSGSARTFHKLPHASSKLNLSYENRLYKGALPNLGSLEGFMRPFVLHSFDLRNDKKLESDNARLVLKHRYPIVFSRLCTASNIARAVDHEMETMISHYGVDKHGFAKMTLLNDEYQMSVKEGTRTQEELHEALDSNRPLFDVCVRAIAKDYTDHEEAEAELCERYLAWEGESDDHGLRFNRSAFSACIRGQVRISATTISGQVTAEGFDLRLVAPIKLAVDDDYYGHGTSHGIDPNKVMRIEWRGSSNLILLEHGDFPSLPQPPKIQKFVMDEVSLSLTSTAQSPHPPCPAVLPRWSG
jgi:hypothetical protein